MILYEKKFAYVTVLKKINIIINIKYKFLHFLKIRKKFVYLLFFFSIFIMRNAYVVHPLKYYKNLGNTLSLDN